MKHTRTWIAAQLVAALALGPASCLAADVTPAAPAENTVWQPHHENFTFSGFTSAYTCDGMEGKVAEILRYFGARKDMQIQAHGCPRGPNSLSHMIWINADFYSLGTAAADAPADSIVHARWTPFTMNTQRPFFIEPGDCELIDAMNPVLKRDFQLRDAAFNVSCTPHQQSLDDFNLKGEVLKSSVPHSG